MPMLDDWPDPPFRGRRGGGGPFGGLYLLARQRRSPLGIGCDFASDSPPSPRDHRWHGLSMERHVAPVPGRRLLVGMARSRRPRVIALDDHHSLFGVPELSAGRVRKRRAVITAPSGPMFEA